MTPTYYAANVRPSLFEVVGNGFIGSEMSFNAFLAHDNDNPTEYINDMDERLLCDVSIVSDHMLIVTPKIGYGPAVPSYLGVITNAATGEAVWVNETKPIPA